MDEVNNEGSVKVAESSPVKGAPKKGGSKKWLLLPVLGIALLLCLCCLTLALAFFSNKDIPVISGLVEKGERLALSDEAEAKIVQEDMVNTMMNLVYNVAAEDGKAPVSVVAFTKAEVEDLITEEMYMESSKYEAKVKLEMEEGTFIVDANGVIDAKEDQKTQMSMVMDGSFSTQGVTLDLSGELRAVDEQVYLQINKMPAIPELTQLGLDSASLKDKWFTMPVENTGSLVEGSASQVVPNSTDDPKTIEDLKKIKSFLESDAVNKTIERIDDEVHDGVRTNCFRMTLNDGNIQEVLAQAAKDLGGEEMTAEEVEQLKAVLEKVQFEVCKGRRDGQIYRVDLSVDMLDENSGKMNFSLSMKMSEYGKDHKVEKPSDAMPLEQLLMQSMPQVSNPASGIEETEYTDEELDELLKQYEGYDTLE